MRLAESILGRLAGVVRDRSSPHTGVAVALLTALVVLSEALLFVDRPYYALWGHLLTLVLCVLAPLRFAAATEVVQAFALVPAFRLVNLGMPIFFELTLLWFPFVYAPLIPAALYLAAHRPDVPLTTGWRLTVLTLPVAVVVSAVLGAVEYNIIEPAALISAATVPQFALLFVVQTAFVGLLEELLYRGVLQRTLKAHIGTVGALFIANLLFGMMHSAYGTPYELLFAGLLGLFYGVVYEWTESLPLVVLLHGCLNTMLFGVYPIYGVPFTIPGI